MDVNESSAEGQAPPPITRDTISGLARTVTGWRLVGASLAAPAADVVPSVLTLSALPTVDKAAFPVIAQSIYALQKSSEPGSRVSYPSPTHTKPPSLG